MSRPGRPTQAGCRGSLPMLLAAREGAVPGKGVGVDALAIAGLTHEAFAMPAGPDGHGGQDLAGRDNDESRRDQVLARRGAS